MQLPPKRVIAVVLILMFAGARGLYAFVPRSYPAGLALPLLAMILVVLAGIGLLFRMEWARLLALAFSWIAVVTGGFYVLRLSYTMIATSAGTSLLQLAVTVICTGGYAAAIWALHSQGTRTWTRNEELPNQTTQPTVGG